MVADCSGSTASECASERTEARAVRIYPRLRRVRGPSGLSGRSGVYEPRSRGRFSLSPGRSVSAWSRGLPCLRPRPPPLADTHSLSPPGWTPTPRPVESCRLFWRTPYPCPGRPAFYPWALTGHL